MKDVILPYLQKILEAAEKGIEIAQQEIPLIVEEWITYNAIYHWSLSMVGILLGVVALVSAKRLIVRGYHMNGSDGEVFAGILIGIFGGAGSLILFFKNIFEAIKVTWFPRVWLLEQAMELIK